MTTRRTLLTMMATAAAGAAAGCNVGTQQNKTAPSGVPDVLMARTQDGLAVIRGSEVQSLGTGAASLSGSTVCVAKAGAVSVISTLSGVTTGRYEIAGDWVPRTVATAGDLVALTRPVTDAVHPSARKSTTIVFGGAVGEVLRHELPGVIEPDAFTADGTGLFVLEWLPATAPDHYRVRHLTMGSGKLSPLYTRDKVPIPAGDEEEMRGEGRAGVPSPDRKVLYTLYTHQPGHQHTRDLISGRTNPDVHAFVHTLQLEQGWAYCVDLPLPFGLSDAAAYTSTLSADGVWLFVADLAVGKLAVINTEALAVTKVLDIPRLTGAAYATAARDRVFIGAGETVTVLDRLGGPVTSWNLDRPLRGLAVSHDQDRVYLGFEGGVSWRDLDGNRLGETALTGLLSVVRGV
jgi:hypothetical protein